VKIEARSAPICGELATVGLVEPHAGDDGEVSWTSPVNGIYFEITGDPEAQRAARDLSTAAPSGAIVD
jgi:hypothetical protein